MTETERLPILQITEQGSNANESVVVKEFALAIILNKQGLATLLCSPTNLKYLTIGFLFSEGLIKGKDELKEIIVDEGKGIVRVETEGGKVPTNNLSFKPLIASGGGKSGSFSGVANIKGMTKIDSQIGISAHEVFSLVEEFQHCSRLYKITGGVHSAALCDTKSIQIFSDDIGRHNAIDKIIGECLLRDIPTDNQIIITSGRISSEILLRVAKKRIPVLISVSAPTNLGVRLATDLGVTLIGFVRGNRMNVYANEWRVRV